MCWCGLVWEEERAYVSSEFIVFYAMSIKKSHETVYSGSTVLNKTVGSSGKLVSWRGIAVLRSDRFSMFS